MTFTFRNGRRWSLRSHLIGLALAVLLPALSIGAAAAWHLAETYRGAFQARLTDTSRALALAIDGEIEALQTAAVTLAASPTLRAGDLAAFRPWAEEVARRLSVIVAVADAGRGHQQILNTAFPPEPPLPTGDAPGASRAGTPLGGAEEVIARAVATGEPSVSDLFEEARVGRKLIGVAAPVQDAEAAVLVSLDVARLARLLEAQAPSGGGIVGIGDRSNRIVARSRDHELYAGRQAPGTFAARASTDSGVFVNRTSDGARALYAFRRLQRAPGWYVVVAEPFAAYQASWVNPMLGLFAGGGVALGLAIALAMALARRIRRPVSALLRRAEAIAAGSSLVRPQPLPPAAVAEFEALRVAVERADAALRQGEAEFHAAFEQAAVPMSQVDCATGILLRVNPAYCALLGRSQEEVVGRPFSDFVHPEDRDADREGFFHMVAGKAPVHEVEKRYVQPDGSIRRTHLVSSVVRDGAGTPLRSLAIVQDVTERREAEERQKLLAREVDHRAKNALAVVQGALRLTPREDAEAYAQAVEGRVSALARAHTLLAECRWTGADLRALAEGELQPFLVSRPDAAGAEADPPRAEISGPAVRLGASMAQPFSMVLHELATNAVKHGALSTAGGVVRLSWELARRDGVLRLSWAEEGGPPVSAPPQRRGFGSRVIETTVRMQLGGEVERRWEAGGLVCEMSVPLGRLARAS